MNKAEAQIVHKSKLCDYRFYRFSFKWNSFNKKINILFTFCFLRIFKA